MEVLLLRSRSRGEIRVVDARQHASVPPGFHGHVLGPGEWYLGLPFESWSRRIGETLILAPPPSDPSPALEEDEEEVGPLARSLLVAPGLALAAESVLRLVSDQDPGSGFRLAALATGFALAWAWNVKRARQRD